MEGEPNHSERQKTKWDQLAKPSSEELPIAVAEQIDIEDSTENGEEAASPEWVRKFLEKYWTQKKAEAPGFAKEEAANIRDINQQFIKYHGEVKAGGGFMRKKEFLKWEKEYTEAWGRLQMHLTDGELRSTESEAEVEEAMFFTKDEDTLHETIEAQAGEYYRERARALRDAILASDDPKKEADLKELDTFFASVYHHVAFKRMTPYEQRSKYGSGGHEYENARTNAHNDVIEHLNRLNNLARKYGTTPFTPRNFWKSIKTKQTDSVARRMRYDRDVVEEYYAIAFSREF